ncbi:hypothetical protein GF351_00740 [Candidatus Woesearchaeota archaeon]|nr:hypothetical protein [Candidatus Woesearchaeota archaeon]
MEIKNFLESFMKKRLKDLKDIGIVNSHQISRATKTQLLGAQAGLRARVIQGDKDFPVLRSISLLAQIMKVQHALELVETQGITALHSYMTKLMEESGSTKVKAVKAIVKDLDFRSAFIKTEKLFEQGTEHPKLAELKKLVDKETEKDARVKIIVFSQYRDSATRIKEELGEEISSEIFVGQAKKKGTGLSQKQQAEMLDRFKQGEFNVLIATSVAEEGIDIPRVDLVVFYEPIPSAIRQIQRRGRTGRQDKGRVVVMMAKDTRDEAYRWSAFHKEKRMHRNLNSLKSKIGIELQPKRQSTIQRFISEEDKFKVFCDHREKGSGVIKELIELGMDTRLEHLQTADFILSSRVGVEYKNVSDFVQSLIDGRLLQQAKELKQSFERPLIVVEGLEDIYSIRNVHPNAIRGMVAAIAVSYGIPVVYTKHFKETASLLSIIAKREQEETCKDFSMHTSKKPLTLREQQEYVVSALPNVGPSLAKDLLKRFGTVRKVINAEPEELKKTEKLGDRIADKIRDVAEKDYIEK